MKYEETYNKENENTNQMKLVSTDILVSFSKISRFKQSTAHLKRILKIYPLSKHLRCLLVIWFDYIFVSQRYKIL